MAKRSIVLVAQEILQKEKRPLHYREITKRLLLDCALSGPTPHESVRSRIGSDKRFKRISEGVYGLSEWKEYPVARFAKNIAFDVLKTRGGPMPLYELGIAILKERQFVGRPAMVARNCIRNDPRFYLEIQEQKVGLTEWKRK